MIKKYELLTNDTIEINGNTLYRIRALLDFVDVKAGDLGGYIQSEDNLSHEGDCWVYGNATVCENARVYGNAHIYDNVWVYCNARVHGNARVHEFASVAGNAEICGEAEIYGNARIIDIVEIYSNAQVYGDACISGNIELGGNPYIKSNNDFINIGPIGSRDDYTTFYRTKDKGIYVCCGCFNGSLEKFEKAVKERHEDNKYGIEYMKAIEMAKIKLV